MNAVVSIVLLAAVLGVIVFLLSRRGKTAAAVSTARPGYPNSAPTLHWTSASTGWTNTTTPTCSSTTAAGSGTAAFCCT